jgi:hypothetical protein
VIIFNIKRQQIDRLKKAIEGIQTNLDKELAVVINKTAKATLGQIAKDIGTELNTTQKAIKYGGKALQVLGKATVTNPGVIVRVTKTGRMSLRHFKPKQNELGVKYKISKTKGNAFIKSAFMGPIPGLLNAQWKGNVFKRKGEPRKMKKGRYAGKIREPITKLNAASPWGVYVAKNFQPEQVRRINERLEKEMEERIRFRVATAFNKAKPRGI